MGLWSETFCPLCGLPGARKFLWMVKCANPRCAKYEGQVVETKPKKATKPLSGSFDPGVNGIEIRYRNHRGEEKTYTGDRSTLRVRGKHISLCLAPTGARASFLKTRLLNLSDIEPLIQTVSAAPGPSGVERQVLGYYKKRGGTSPRHQEILRKYSIAP